MAETRVATIEGFTGLNLGAPAEIDDHELTQCINFDLGDNGELNVRRGTKHIAGGRGGGASITASSQLLMIGYLKTATVSQMIACNGSKLYTSSDGGTTWTNRQVAGVDAGDVRFGIQYVDKFYMVRSNAVMLVWDGTTLTAIATSPAGTTMGVYKNRMFVGNTFESTGFASRVYYTDAAGTGGTTFLTANWAGLSTFIDVSPGDGDVVVAMSVLNDNFLLFKGNSVWDLSVADDVANWQLRNVAYGIGCASVFTVHQFQGLLYFLSPGAVYRTDGATFEEISVKLRADFSKQIPGFGSGQMPYNACAAAIWEHKYIISLVGKTSIYSGQIIYVYHIQRGGWTQYNFSGNAVQVLISNFLPVTYPENSVAAYAGLYMGWGTLPDGSNSSLNMYRFGGTSELAIFHDDGQGYAMQLQTKEFDFGDPINTKRMKYTVIDWVGPGDNKARLTYNLNVTFGKLLAVPIVFQGAYTANRVSTTVKGTGFFRTVQFLLSFNAIGDPGERAMALYSITTEFDVTKKRFANK